MHSELGKRLALTAERFFLMLIEKLYCINFLENILLKVLTFLLRMSIIKASNQYFV